MSKATCATCPHWLSPDGAVGQCRRFPPLAAIGAATIRPQTYARDWCGEHPDRHTHTVASGRPEPAENKASVDLRELSAAGAAVAELAAKPKTSRKSKAR